MWRNSALRPPTFEEANNKQLTVRQLTYTLAFLLLGAVSVQAQDKNDKALKEELKRYKKMSPEQIKLMKDNLTKKSDELKRAEANYSLVAAQLRDVQSAQATNDSLENALREENTRLKSELDAAKTAAAAMPATSSASSMKASSKMAMGTTYGVQIGAYSGYAMPKSAMGSGVREDRDGGLVKYVVGSYKERSQAESLQQALVEMGIKDAFIVMYRDGQRVAGN